MIEKMMSAGNWQNERERQNVETTFKGRENVMTRRDSLGKTDDNEWRTLKIKIMGNDLLEKIYKYI